MWCRFLQTFYVSLWVILCMQSILKKQIESHSMNVVFHNFLKLINTHWIIFLIKVCTPGPHLHKQFRSILWQSPRLGICFNIQTKLTKQHLLFLSLTLSSKSRISGCDWVSKAFQQMAKFPSSMVTPIDIQNGTARGQFSRFPTSHYFTSFFSWLRSGAFSLHL